MREMRLMNSFAWNIHDKTEITKKEYCDWSLQKVNFLINDQDLHKNIDQKEKFSYEEMSNEGMLQTILQKIDENENKVNAIYDSVKEIPAFLVDIENLNCPYLFKFLSDEEFKAFIENIESSVNPQSSGTTMESIENRIDQGQKVLNSLTENMESLTKQPSIYLQLLCG